MSQTPAVTGKQLLKLLEGQGWYVKRIRGSQHILRHPSISDAIPIPIYGISRSEGHARDIRRTAGISREEFDRLL